MGTWQAKCYPPIAAAVPSRTNVSVIHRITNVLPRQTIQLQLQRIRRGVRATLPDLSPTKKGVSLRLKSFLSPVAKIIEAVFHTPSVPSVSLSACKQSEFTESHIRQPALPRSAYDCNCHIITDLVMLLRSGHRGLAGRR